MDLKKIAIYSGEIPSTTFIERLIVGMADSNFKIYLFGYKKHKMAYSKNIKVVAFSSKLHKFFMLIQYTVLLSLFKPSDKKRLDTIMKLENRYTFLFKIKFYPVLYHQPDIFHLQWAKSIEEWIWVKQFGIKIVLSLRGAHINYTPISNPEYAIIYKNQFPLVDGFHAVSNAIASEATKYNARLDRINIIYSGLNLQNLKFKSKEKSIEKPFKIISIGRSHWKKGYQYALDAFSILNHEGFDFKYTIIGIEHDEELIFQRHQLGLEEKVRFKTKMSLNAIFEEIHKADVLLLPSLEEGIANVVLEAMAIGTLVISTNCGGMLEVLKDGETGFIIPVRNVESIVEKIKKVKSLTTNDYLTITHKARVKITMQHTDSIMVQNMKKLYNDVLLKEN